MTFVNPRYCCFCIPLSSVATLSTLKKSELLSLATHYKLEIDTSAQKADVRKALSDHLVDEDLILGGEEESSPELEVKRLKF